MRRLQSLVLDSLRFVGRQLQQRQRGGRPAFRSAILVHGRLLGVEVRLARRLLLPLILLFILFLRLLMQAPL